MVLSSCSTLTRSHSMKFKIFRAEKGPLLSRVDSFETIIGVIHNGERFQLKGHSLAQMGVENDKMMLRLHHDMTPKDNGNFDILLLRINKEYIFHQCKHAQPINILDEILMKRLWPTGIKDLKEIVNAAEAWIGGSQYEPGFEAWLTRTAEEVLAPAA